MILVCGLLADSLIELVCPAERLGLRILIPGREALPWPLPSHLGGGRAADPGRVETPEGAANLEDLTGVYARYVDYHEEARGRGLSPLEQPFAVAEYQASVMNLLDMLPCAVLNRPKASTSNDSKVFQGGLVVDCGLLTPRTLVTTDPDDALAFYEACGAG